MKPMVWIILAIAVGAPGLPDRSVDAIPVARRCDRTPGATDGGPSARARPDRAAPGPTPLAVLPDYSIEPDEDDDLRPVTGGFAAGWSPTGRRAIDRTPARCSGRPGPVPPRSTRRLPIRC